MVHFVRGEDFLGLLGRSPSSGFISKEYISSFGETKKSLCSKWAISYHSEGS